MSSPTDLVKPSSRREVVLFEQAYNKGCDDTYAAMNQYFERELWRARHPIRYALQRFTAWLRSGIRRAHLERVDDRG